MASEKQLEANRENAQKSTGPTSQEGKDRSRLNAFRHGGCARLMPEEDHVAYIEFAEPVAASFDPQGANEIQLAQQYADIQWKLHRLAAIEETLFTMGNIEGVGENFQLEHAQAHNAVSNAKTYRDDGADFTRLSMHTQRLTNCSVKVQKQLHQIQAERRKREQAELPHAAIIYKNYRDAGGAFDPKEIGFVLTIPQIQRYVRIDELKNRVFVAAEVEKSRLKVA